MLPDATRRWRSSKATKQTRTRRCKSSKCCKMLLEDEGDEMGPRGCKYPSPPCALAQILPETTVRAKFRQIENASPITNKFLTFSTNIVCPCRYTLRNSQGAGAIMGYLGGNYILICPLLFETINFKMAALSPKKSTVKHDNIKAQETSICELYEVTLDLISSSSLTDIKASGFYWGAQSLGSITSRSSEKGRRRGEERWPDGLERAAEIKPMESSPIWRGKSLSFWRQRGKLRRGRPTTTSHETDAIYLNCSRIFISNGTV